MDDFRMELHAIEAPAFVFNECVCRIFCSADSLKALRELFNPIAVGVPDLNGGRNAVEELSAAFK